MTSVRITGFRVAGRVAPDSQTSLNCWFELAPRERFYALKWYLQEREFYRLYGRPPKATPRRQVFPLPGVSVDVSPAALAPLITCCRCCYRSRHSLLHQLLRLSRDPRRRQRDSQSAPPATEERETDDADADPLLLLRRLLCRKPDYKWHLVSRQWQESERVNPILSPTDTRSLELLSLSR